MTPLRGWRAARASRFLSDGNWSAFVNDQDAEVGQEFLAGNVNMGVRYGVDADDVMLAGLGEKICHRFLEPVAAHFHAIYVADALDAEFAVAFLRGDFKRGQRLGDEMVLWCVMDGHAQVHLDLGGGGTGDGIDRRSAPISRFADGFGSRGLQVGGGGRGNPDLLRAGGAGDFLAGPGAVHFQLLVALW